MSSIIYHTVYKITNNVNGKFYIGVHSTLNINDDYLGSGYKIKYAIKKYGKENFKKEILYVFNTVEEAYQKEAEIVTEEFVLQKDTYNITVGGKIPPRKVKGSQLTEEHKKRISESMKGKRLSEEHKQKLSEIHTGKKLTEEHKQKLKERKLSEEHKKRISESMKGKCRGAMSEEHKQALRKPKRKK